jgi:hypothetical protein
MSGHSYLAICEEEGIPLWKSPPTLKNISNNVVIIFLDPYCVCVVIMDYEDDTSLVAYNGMLAYAVTQCLVEGI